MRLQIIEKNRGNYFRMFTRLATIIGFIVDIITIVSILLAIRVSEESLTIMFSGIPITPELAFSIWVLATFTYFGILHSIWERIEKSANGKGSFWNFLWKDLIVRFERPFLLLPIIVLILLLFWISAEIAIGIIIIGTIFIISLGVPFGMDLNDEKERAKKLIDENWADIELRINLELDRQLWIGFSRLSDLATIWNFSDKFMDYALIKYAVANSDKAVYGHIYETRENEPITNSKVLICLEKLEENGTYYYK